MYVPTQPILVTRAVYEIGYQSHFVVLRYNGTYLRTPLGENLGKAKKPKRPSILYKCETDQGIFKGVINDKLLVERIVTYINEYYNKKFTNCSAFAHFLFTGEFVECSPEHNLMVVADAMRPYVKGSRVAVGDMVCVLYANTWLCQSRKSPWRKEFMEAKKKHAGDSRFVHVPKVVRPTYSAEKLRELSASPVTSDYHFMICVAIYNGLPVWISQRGYLKPGEGEVAFMLTVGEYDGYPEEVPLFTLIKRR